jgi:hypothetical protein
LTKNCKNIIAATFMLYLAFVLRLVHVMSVDISEKPAVLLIIYGLNFVITIYGFKAVKDKAVPLQDWGGPEGSRKLRFPDFMTTAQGGGKVVSLKHRPPLPPRKYTWYSFLLEAESTPGP